jgi:hypothetical protein
MAEGGLGQSLATEATGGKRTDSGEHTRISVSVSVSARVRTTGKHTRVSVSDSVSGLVSVLGGAAAVAAVAEWISNGRHGSSGSEQQAEKIRSGEECRWKRRG